MIVDITVPPTEYLGSVGLSLRGLMYVRYIIYNLISYANTILYLLVLAEQPNLADTSKTQLRR